MKRSRTTLALVLTAAVTAPSAHAMVIGDAGQAPDSDAALAARSAALNQQYGLDAAGTASQTPRSAPPIARMDGVPPDRVDATVSTTAAVTPPDRVDALAPTPVRPIVAEATGGFDWTDAGIGFAAAAGLALLGSGSLMTTRWRREARTLAH